MDFTYDLAGQLDTIKRYTSIVDTSAPVAVSDFNWDQAGRLSEIQHRTGSDPAGGMLLAGYSYDWNQRNELTALDFLPSIYDSEDVTAYNYDPRGQLVGADYNDPNDDESYAYDDNGNRLAVTNTAGANQDYDTLADNQLTNDSTYTYQYDNEGNRTRRFIDGNQNGLYDAGDTGITEYAWDHRNRLASATSFASHGGSATKQVYHTYDAQNQWTGRLVVEGTSIVRTVFVWEAGQIALEFVETGFGALGAVETDDLSHRYLWGPAIDQLLVDEVVNSLTNASLNERLWALSDHLGSVRDVIDDDGTVRKHTVFDSYGRVTGETYRDIDEDLISAFHAEGGCLVGLAPHSR